MSSTFGLRSALASLVLIAIAPVFAIVVRSSLAEQAASVRRAESSVNSLADFAAAQEGRLVEGARLLPGAVALAPGASLMVADSRGTVLASGGPDAAAVGSTLPFGFLRDALQSGQSPTGRAFAESGGEWMYSVRRAGRYAGEPLFVTAIINRDAVVASSVQRLRDQLLALALIALLAALMAWWFGDRVLLRPMARMLRRVDALAREELPFDDPLPRRGVVELRDLEHRFREMARSLAERSVQRDMALSETEGQNRLLESVLESMIEGVMVIAPTGRFIHLNAAARRILPGLVELNRRGDSLASTPTGLGVRELEGDTPLTPETSAARMALAGDTVDNFRYRVLGPLSAGVEKVIQGHARPIRSPDGRNFGALVVFSDITSAWKAEQDLKEREKRYRTLFESNPHPMWVYDAHTLEFLTVNDAAIATYGYSAAEFAHMRITDIRPAQDVEGLLSALPSGGMNTPTAWRHRLRDGRVIDVEVTSHSMDYDGRPARMVLALDVTERLKAQEAMQLMNETLERHVEERTRQLAVSNRELESFSYSVSHDLRAPLQVIDGFSRALLANHSAHLDAQARHYLDRIRENTRQMSALIDDLLSLARVTRADLRREPVDLALKSVQVVDRLRQRSPERVVAVEIDDTIPCTGDPGLLGVVMENLIENAWKFTARASHARIRIGRRRSGDGKDVYFVSDNGAGFDMTYADKLFTAFQRLHTSAEFQGTGIGLATVHRVVTRHGGRVWVDARMGEGATFEFTLNDGAARSFP